MKKASVVQNYRNVPVSGIYNMHEKSNMMCSKMMDIEDEVRVGYNLTSAMVTNQMLNPVIPGSDRAIANSLYNTSNNYVKKNAILSLAVDAGQTQLDSNNLTKWIFEFDSKYLLREYLYNEIYTLNPQSAFRSIQASTYPDLRINKLCYDYIDFNILDRYRLKEFVLWTSYHELKNNTVPGTGTDPILNPVINLLYKTPVYSFNAIPNNSTSRSVVDTQKETVATKQYSDGIYDITYKQKKSSQYYTFIWYYDAIYERI